MSYPRLIVHVDKFRYNVRTVAGWCRDQGVSLAYVTKCTLADPVLCRIAREEGAAFLADSRLLNLSRLVEDLPRMMLRASARGGEVERWRGREVERWSGGGEGESSMP